MAKRSPGWIAGTSLQLDAVEPDRWSRQRCPAHASPRYQMWCPPEWATLVRKSVGAVEDVEGLAQVVGDGVGSGDGLPSGLDLDDAIAAGGLDDCGPKLSGRPGKAFSSST